MRATSILLLSVCLACSGKDKSSDKQPKDTGTTTTAPGTPPGSTTVTLPATSHNNLLIVSVDTMRKDHFSRYDPENRNLTPFIDSLMETAVVAENHHPGSDWTFHSFSTMLSGRYPVEHDVLPRVVPNDHRGWPVGTRFLGDELGDAGFHTIMASANGWLRPEYGLTAGYDSYLGQAFDQADLTYNLGSTALQQAIDGGSADRWHLHLHFLEPHAPYTPPVEYRIGEDQLDPLPWDIDSQPEHYSATGQWPDMTPEERALLEAHLHVRYEGEIRWLDDMIQSFWTDMDQKGWLDDTLVVFTTDHGEQFWERGQQSHAFHLFPEETDGVLFLWSKELEAHAQSVNLHTSGADIPPTLFRHLGLDAPDSWTGLPLSEIPPERPVFWDVNGRLGTGHGVVKGQHEMLYLWSGDTWVHDLTADPGRQNNRFDPMDDTTHELWGLLQPRVETCRPLAPAQDPVAPVGLSF